MSMLHRSFKPAKCKTALKLAVSRIKLLKNKREAQLKQLKREVAQLLESGQDRTARIRVEHVVREEKTTAAYELIEIYCELIVARLSIIESQKNCPIDLKEAISSVIFAAPRCADIPELMDIRKQFTAKYGKDFVSSAIELRPDCGVGRMLVEKLSAKAPDGQTKMKILSTIAEEHNVKWDPNSLEEQDTRPPEDILNGPNTFEKAISNAFPGRISSIHDEQIDHAERDILAGATESFYRDEHKDNATYTWSASSKSTTASIYKNPLANISQETDRYPQKTLSELKNRESLGGVSLKKQSSNNEIKILGELNDDTESENSNNEIEFFGELNDGTESEKVNYIGDLGTRRQSSRASSDSYSHTFINDHNDNLNLNHTKLGSDVGQRPFVIDEGNSHSDNEKTTSYDKGSVVFDEYGSDDGDDYKFDVQNEFKGQESSLYFSSPGRKSAVNLLENTDTWRHGKNMEEPFEKSISQSHSFSGQHSTHVFPESYTVPTEPRDSLDATYDNSDDQSSDDNENLEKSKFVANTEPGIYPSKQDDYERNSELNKSASHGLIGSSSAEMEHVAYKREPLLPPSSVDSDPMEVRLEKNQGKEFHAVSDRKFGNSDLPSSKHEITGLHSRIEDKEHMPQLPDTWKDNELLKESSLESGNELRFGKLTGGLRNKGLRRPPYSRDQSGHASLFKQASGDSSSKIEQFSSSVMVRTTINPDAHNQEPHNQKVTSKQSKEPSSKDLVFSSDSDNDDSEQLSPQNISINQEPYNRKLGTELNKNSSSNIPIPYFDVDTSDSEEDLPKQASTRNVRPITVFSRRTKAPSSSTRSSYLKATDGSEASLTPDYGARRKSSSRSSHATEVPAKPMSQTKSLDHLGSSERHVTAEQSTSKPMPASKRSLNEESLKSSTRKYSSSSLPKTQTSGSSKISESASPSMETPPTEKASHVHPKLPDYDTLAAKFQSLRRSSE
ncbi:hypothetical protein I3842_04G151800 [Carya illinoinensis]|uniref:IST1-like protein n=1 Tax=Carya illinoinensis TaxID=32201 RepID=A0A922FAM2_CARIL|nr:hypothetical protein I3842_04G151800 [Carya illinoinensis]